MMDLPNSWITAEIAELVEPQKNGKPFQQGWSPQCERRAADDGEWGVVKTTAIQPGKFQDHENKALPEKLKPRPQIEISPGDILMTCAGPRNRCGVSCLVERTRPRLMMSGKMYRFRPHPKVLSANFLSLFIRLHNTQLRIDAMKTGISDSGLNLTHSRFGQLPVVVPPLNEQRRIVERIEALFAEIDQGVKNLQAAKQKLALYRQSLLKSAFEGRLTAEWRKQNTDQLESPEALLARIRQERESRTKTPSTLGNKPSQNGKPTASKAKNPPKPKPPELKALATPANNFISLELPNTKDLPEGWVKVRLAEICAINPRIDKTRIDSDSMVSFVPMSAVEAETGKINISTTRSFETVRKGYTPFLQDDILFAKITPCMENGKMAIVPELPNTYGFGSTEFHILRPFAGINPRLIYYSVSRRSFRFHAERNMTGAVGQKRVPAIVLESYEIGLPSTDEQTEIVRILDRRLEAAERLNAAINSSLNRAETLRQSILKQAFSGQLVPQNPDDEPASKLLARIKIEQAAAPASKRKKRATA